MKISNKINGMENAQAARRAEKKEKEKREDKRKNGKAEKLFEMNLKLCAIHNHEARDS